MDDNMLLNLALDAGEIMLAGTNFINGRGKSSRSNYVFQCTNC